MNKHKEKSDSHEKVNRCIPLLLRYTLFRFQKPIKHNYTYQKIIAEDRLPEKVNRIAGIDVAYTDELAIGAAHPYGCGFVSHLRLAIGKPTVGVAKSRLFGEPKKIVGKEFLFQNERVIVEFVTTKKGTNPVYVSVGHISRLEQP